MEIVKPKDRTIRDVVLDADIDKAILVWPFYEAPLMLRAMSNHGGDEDWVALIGPDATDKDPSWAWEGSTFGCCDVQYEKLAEGFVLLIGAHA